MYLLVYKCSMRRGTQVALSVLGVALLGAATNVATGILPSAWKSYLWLAWPAIGILIIVLIILEIAAQRRPTGQPQRHHPVMARSILIRRVRSFWIQGVLERSLYHEARIELDLAAAVEGGHHPWEVIASRPNGAVVEFPAGTDVKKMFEEFDRTIVITGDPGSGKTTMLLDLAQCLLEEAAADEDKQVPVVLPLSSWATHRKPIAEWVSDQLVSQYGMPQQLASDWVSDQVIIPLFDGLDEVPEEVREGCMTAIRDYHRTHGLSGGVLCCRGNEYNALRERLDRNGVLAIQPLSRGQVERYLHSAGPALEGVRAALVSDPGLWDLAESPLLLSIMALAYQNGHGTLETTSPDDRQHNLFAQYVRTMLQRRESPRYPLELSTKYLTTLAWELRNTNQTVFALDMISSRWAFPPAELDVPARTISTILCGLIMLGAGLILSGWQAGVVACIFAAVFGHRIFPGRTMMTWGISPTAFAVIATPQSLWAHRPTGGSNGHSVCCSRYMNHSRMHVSR